MTQPRGSNRAGRAGAGAGRTSVRGSGHLDEKAGHAKTAAAVVGGVFLVVGILGFIPGITTDYDTMEFAGHESQAMLLGLFQVSILHNIVHLLFGVAGLAAARTAMAARYYLAISGVVYLVLWIYGLLIDHDSDANFVPVNNADNWLHLGLGVGMLALAALVWDRGTTRSGTTR